MLQSMEWQRTTTYIYISICITEVLCCITRNIPGGPVVNKNPPANAGNMDLIPGPGRSHTWQSNLACVPQLLSPDSRAEEPQQEKPLQ